MTTTETTPKAPKVHLQVAVIKDSRLAHRNFCGVFGDLAQPLAGLDPIHGPGTTGQITCDRCKSAMVSMGLLLEQLVPLRADVVAARERAYAVRRLEWHTPSFTKAVQAVAEDLRRKADEIERTLARFSATAVPSFGTGPAVVLAAEVQHQVLWMLANLNLDTLTANAAELDQLAREAK